MSIFSIFFSVFQNSGLYTAYIIFQNMVSLEQKVFLSSKLSIGTLFVGMEEPYFWIELLLWPYPPPDTYMRYLVYLVFTTGSGPGTCLQFLLESLYLLEWVKGYLSFKMKQGRHLGAGRETQNSRWRPAAIFIILLPTTPLLFGVFWQINYLNILIWGLGIQI